MMIGMRIAVSLVLLVGCVTESVDPTPKCEDGEAIVDGRCMAACDVGRCSLAPGKSFAVIGTGDAACYCGTPE